MSIRLQVDLEYIIAHFMFYLAQFKSKVIQKDVYSLTSTKKNTFKNAMNRTNK